MEVISHAFFPIPDSLGLIIFFSIEESLERLRCILLIYSLMKYHKESIKLRIY